jgi:hypothetical protein
MKGLLTVSLTLAVAAVSVSSAEAFGCRRRGCADTCAPAVQVQWVEKAVTAYRPEWKERQVTCTINRVVPREVVENVKRTCMVPEMRPVKQMVTYYEQVPAEVTRTITHCQMVPETVPVTITRCRMVPQQVVQNVTCCRLVPMCVTDPCTGCTRTVCRPENYTQQVTRTVLRPEFYQEKGMQTVCRPHFTSQQVKETVMRCVPRQREVTVQQCFYRPVEQTYQVRRMVCDIKPEIQTRTERFCVMVPYQTTVKVPVCVPCP